MTGDVFINYTKNQIVVICKDVKEKLFKIKKGV